MNGRIIHGDALEKLKELPKNSIDMSMSSPPYWALRDYGVEGQLGLEKTPEEFIDKLCDIYDEVKRVLKPTGTCWVNLGDTYGGSGVNDGSKNPGISMDKRRASVEQRPSTKLVPKSLIGIPFRFAIEMINRGWILRNTIIWKKNNCMPQSAKDRFTVDFEYIFFFSKQKKYYFDMQREPLSEKTHPSGNGFARPQQIQKGGRGNETPWKPTTQGRSKRCVWTINPKTFPEAHFAVYPEELCETPIKAGCPEFVCRKCWKPREKLYKPSEEYAKHLGKEYHDQQDNKSIHNSPRKKVIADYRFKGYSTPCSCDAGYEPGTVLDPFLGSGTTALVAEKLNRKWVGIELNEEYVKIAEKRLAPYMNQSRLLDYADKPVPEGERAKSELIE